MDKTRKIRPGLLSDVTPFGNDYALSQREEDDRRGRSAFILSAMNVSAISRIRCVTFSERNINHSIFFSLDCRLLKNKNKSPLQPLGRVCVTHSILGASWTVANVFFPGTLGLC